MSSPCFFVELTTYLWLLHVTIIFTVCEAKPLDVHKIERVLDDLIAELEVDSQVDYDTREINKNIKRLKEVRFRWL